MQCIDCIPLLLQADCSINSKLNNSKSQAKSRITPNSKLLTPNSDGGRRPPCKYCTKSKNMLQNKN